MKQKSVLIVGAGLAGIAAAAHLAQPGLHVIVLEKKSLPGGRCDHIIRGGHTFDTGPTLFIMEPVYEAEFAALGASLREMLDLKRVDPTYHLIFDNGAQLGLTSDLLSMQEQLEAIEPDSFQGFLRYMDEGHRHYNQAMRYLVNREIRNEAYFLKISNLQLLFSIKKISSQ